MRTRMASVLPRVLLPLLSTCGNTFGASAGTSGAHHTVHIDTAAVGPEFHGLGGCSAGTGPRLLVDYPEPARSTLLDFLFLPNHGASLDILKLEIGGEGDSTTGTESSHEPREGVFDFHSGYEWFMMTEAVKRNPNITVYGLPWSFPSWLYHGTNHSTCHTDWVGCVNGPKAAAYIATWVQGAKNVHGVHVSYIGWHNESPWRPEWVAMLRDELDKRGLTSTQIVVGDCGPGSGFQSPGITTKLQPNATVDLSKIADVVGLHYPVSIMPVAKEPTGSPGQYYQALWDLPGKQKLWASEEYSTYSDSNGGRCLAKLVNRNYVDGNFTALIVWDMVWAWMDGLACSGQGMIWAGEPWSGVIGLVDTVWSIGHTTQVTEVGWRLLKKSGPWGTGGSGYLPSANGSATPMPTRCLPDTWPANASGVQCSGLSAHPSAFGSATECAQACCDDPHCSVWQWAASGKSPAGFGCWVGRKPLVRNKCSVDNAWVGGSRTPPQPVPAPTHCDNPTQFPSNSSSIQCAGLTADGGAKTSGDCAVACCNDQACAVWQFSNGSGGGCWRGTCQQPPVGSKGWVGGSRVAPSPPPAPPAPPPQIGGSYVSYVSSAAPEANFSLVLETMNNADSKCAYGNGGWGAVPAGPNHLNFCLSNSVCQHHRRLFVTHSPMSVVGPDAPRFVKLQPVVLSTGGAQCCFDMSLDENSVYSLSTRDTARKGIVPAEVQTSHAPEGAAVGCGYFPTVITKVVFPLDYQTDFSKDRVRFNDLPEFLSDVQGIFRIRQDPFAAELGQARRQVLQQLTIEPRNMSYSNGYGQLPLSVLGSKNWSDYKVSTVARTNGTGAAATDETIAVYGRCGHSFAFSAAGGYVLQISPATSMWTLATGNTHEHVLAHGACPGSPTCTGWIELEIAMVGSTITATIGGNTVATVTDTTFSKGMAGLGSGWHPSWFQRFAVAPVEATKHSAD